MKKFLILAGEESGLIYADRLRREIEAALSARGEAASFRGYQSEGFETGDLAVMGFWAVLRKIFFFLRVRRTMERVIREWRPDAVVSVDYPGLNLRLDAYAKSLGIPAVHLVCPQVWAWHQDRIPKIARGLTKLLCFLPFEPALFDGTGLDVKFIGHPMRDVFREEDAARKAGPQDEVGKVIAVLPGSRVGEITRILPRLLDALSILGRRIESFGSHAPCRAVIPAANEKAEAAICRLLAGRQFGCIPVTVQLGGARDLLRSADCAAVASGTATLEAALARCPTVLVYAVSPMLAWFARRVIKGTKHIGLANVIAVRSGIQPPMPELLQEDFTPEAVADRLEGLLADGEERREAVAALDLAMSKLESDGSALSIAAREVLACLG